MLGLSTKYTYVHVSIKQKLTLFRTTKVLNSRITMKHNIQRNFVNLFIGPAFKMFISILYVYGIAVYKFNLFGFKL